VLVAGVQLFLKAALDVFDSRGWTDIPLEEGLLRALKRKSHLGVEMTEEHRREQYANGQPPDTIYMLNSTSRNRTAI
jgi:hypothetical protein